MTIPPLNMESLMLAAHVTQVLGLIHRIAYAFVSPDLIVRQTSANFSTVLSNPGASFVNKPLMEVVWEFVGAEESLQSVINGKLPYLAFERVNRERPGGQMTYLDLSVTMIDNPELGKGLVVILEDVTHTALVEQRLTQNRNELDLAREKLTQANEELKRLNRQKTLFLSMAVHDLRTPLTVIRAYGDLLFRLLPDDAPEKVRDYIQLINSQTSHMDWLIEDFLDLDQLEQGTLELNLQHTDLNKLVKEVEGSLIYLANRREIELQYLPPSYPILARVDRSRIQQVLFNLINNALKYTPSGGRVEVGSHLAGETAVIRVSDTGIGMTPAEQARAFQLYYQAGGKEQHEARGKGLGLFIVKMLVEAHGGHVSLESIPHQGSTFTVYLPQNPQ